MAEDKNVGDSKLGANGFNTMASEGNSGPPSAKPAGGDMFEGMGSKKSMTSTAPMSVRSAPPPPPTSERMPLPEAKRTLLGIPSPTTPISSPPAPPSVSGMPGTQRAGSASLPNIAPPPARSPVPPAPGTEPANGAASPSGATAKGGGLEMDWDDENEATHVFDKDSQGQQQVASSVGPAAGTPSSAPPATSAPNTTPTTTRGTGTPPPPPPASASMRAAAKISIAPLGATVSQAVGPISAAQSERVLSAGAPPPPPGSMPPASIPGAPRRSTPPPPPSAMNPAAGAVRPSAPPPPPGSMKPPTPPPSSLPPQPTHAPLVATLASASGGPHSLSQPPPFASSVQVTTTPMAMPQPRTEPPRPLEATTLVYPASAGRSWVGVGLGLLGAGVGAFALVLYLSSRPGAVSITAVDANGNSLDHVSIFVDGQKTKCETSPCPLELGAGQHTIKVLADGMNTPEPKLVTVEAGKSLPVSFEFKGEASSGSGASGNAASGGTGLKIASAGTGLKLFVDGQDRGTLPQELKELTVGEHKIRIAGNDRYQALEKTVQVTQGSMLDLGTVTPKVLKGRATIELGTPGAKLSLQAPGEPSRTITTPIPPLDLDTSKAWTLHATKAGFEDLNVPLTFADGEPAEKTFVIALTAKSAASTTTAAAPKAGSTTTSTSSTSSATAEAGTGTLTISSMPASKVVIDGAPAGETPIMNKSVSAGTHRVMLINSDQDLKKTVTVKVKAGEAKKLIVNLKE